MILNNKLLIAIFILIIAFIIFSSYLLFMRPKTPPEKMTNIIIYVVVCRFFSTLTLIMSLTWSNSGTGLGLLKSQTTQAGVFIFND